MGKLTKEAYEQLVPVVDRQIRDRDKLRILLVMHDFHGWTAGALWEDTKFDLKHWPDIERLAIVAKYFDHSQLDEVRVWLDAS